MTFVRKASGSNYTPTTVKRRSSGAWMNVQTIKRRLSGAWVTVWSAYTPISNVQHPDISVAASGLTASKVVSTVLTAPSWTGGNPSPTVTWSVQTGSAQVVNGTTLTTSVAIASGSTISGVVRVTVSDGVSSAYHNCNYALSYTKTS